MNCEILDQLCKIFEGAYDQAKASRRRPITPEQQLFTAQELEWFSKNSYNMSLKHCADMPPRSLVKLLSVCVKVRSDRILSPGHYLQVAQFIRLLKEQNGEGATGDLDLRLAFCEYLAASTYITMARAEDGQEVYVSHDKIDLVISTDTSASILLGSTQTLSRVPSRRNGGGQQTKRSCTRRHLIEAATNSEA